MSATPESEHVVSALVRLDPRDAAAVERAEEGIARLTGAPATTVVPALLPCLVARSWPAPSIRADAHEGGCARVARAAEIALAAAIARVPPVELPTLEQLARSSPFWLPQLYWRRWWSLDADDAPGLLAYATDPITPALLSIHRDGYVRELALTALDPRDRASLPWVVARTLDWVAPVRARAERMTAEQLRDDGGTTTTTLVELLPLFERLQRFGRVDQRALVARVRARLASDPELVHRHGTAHADRSVRAACLELLEQTGHLTGRRLATHLDDRDLGVRLRAARALERATSHAPDDPELGRLVARLLRDPVGRVRAIALMIAARSEDVDVVHGLLMRALDDSSTAMSGLARALLASREPSFDIPGHVRRAVREAPTTGTVIALGEIGAPEDWELLVACLDRSARIASAAIRAMRRLDRQQSRDTRLMMADDPRPSVVRAAGASLAGEVLDDDERFIAAYARSPHEHVRRRAVGLAIQLSGWAPAHLLLPIRDLALRSHIDAQLRAWMARRFRHGASLAAVDAERLRAMVTASDVISADTRRELLSSIAVMTRP
ncbi:MAG: hypothetical protein M3Y87_15565 [Myxococcota bacterium]|nr:hypothetical protein [Myxococcota bacterium]